MKHTCILLSIMATLLFLGSCKSQSEFAKLQKLDGVEYEKIDKLPEEFCEAFSGKGQSFGLEALANENRDNDSAILRAIKKENKKFKRHTFIQTADTTNNVHIYASVNPKTEELGNVLVVVSDIKTYKLTVVKFTGSFLSDALKNLKIEDIAK